MGSIYSDDRQEENKKKCRKKGKSTKIAHRSDENVVKKKTSKLNLKNANNVSK